MGAHDFGRKHWEPVAVHHGSSFISLTLAACRRRSEDYQTAAPFGKRPARKRK
jgi:hypothetical protein